VIGAHVVTVTPPVVGGVAVDISCLVDSVSIHHGRDDTNSQPEASSCSLAVSLNTDEEPLPAALDVGAVVRVTTALTGAPVARFTGRVTDVRQSWISAGEQTPDHMTVEVIATSALAELGRRVVGDTPYGQQLDGARVAAIMAAAGITLDPLFSDPGTVQILPRDIDSQPALDVAQSTAESAAGVVWDTRDGEIRYADANHRYGTAPALSIDSCDILVTPTWARTTEGLINDVSIGYGLAPDGGDQPRYTDTRADSVGRYGRYGFTTATELAALADAAALGQLLLVRNNSPVWVMSELPVAVDDLTADQTAALLGLDMHSLIYLTGLPTAGTAPTTAYLWVEGWSETLAYGVHEMTLTVSGYCRTSPAPWWDNVPSVWTWDTVTPPDFTWDDATCFGPLPTEGRWSDVSASQRWDSLDPAVTWDNYQPA
jgi:hypothetical protein